MIYVVVKELRDVDDELLSCLDLCGIYSDKNELIKDWNNLNKDYGECWQIYVTDGKAPSRMTLCNKSDFYKDL